MSNNQNGGKAVIGRCLCACHPGWMDTKGGIAVVPSWVMDMACLVRQPFRVTGPAMASLKAGLKDSIKILLPSVWNQCRRWERFPHLASGIAYSSSASSRNSLHFNSSYQITSQERTVELCLQRKC